MRGERSTRPQDRYEPTALEALATLRVVAADGTEIRELPIAGLRVGMVFAEDVKLQNGTLVVVRGFEVTHSFLDRLRNFGPRSVREPLRIVAR